MIDINEISQEYVKCMSDKSRIYMIEHFLKTYDMRVRKDVPFKLFPRQKDFLSAIGTYRNNIVSKPRQSGCTTVVASYIACEIALASLDSPETVLIVGRDLKLSENMLEKIEAFLNQLPRWFWGDDYWSPDPNSEKNKASIWKTHNKQRLELFNGCKVYAISSGLNAARGISSVSFLIFDESAFIENGVEVYSQAVATTSTGGHTIMISTPYGKDPLYYGIYSKALKGENNFHVTELRWYQDPRYNCFLKWTRKDEKTGEVEIYSEPTLNEKGEIEYNMDHWEDMVRKGYKPTSPWFEGMCGSFNNDKQKIAQELEVSFIGSSDNVVDPEYIDMQKDMNVRDPNPDYKDKTLEELWIWKLPVEGHRYILSIDNSRGDGADATAFEMIDIDGIDDDGTPCIEQVLEYNGKLFGDVIGELANNYGRLYNNAFVVVESIGGYGDSTLLTLMNLKYPNLYYDDPNLNKYTMQGKPQTVLLSENGKLPGFHSNAVRFQMLSNFANLVKTNQFKIRSRRVTTELETWIYKNGRMDHMDGCHDDTLTCLAMGLFVMMFSMNKQIEAKSKDEAMMKAMIFANSRIVIGHSNNSNNGVNKNVMNMIYKSDPTYLYNNDGAAKYKSCMWLLK